MGPLKPSDAGSGKQGETPKSAMKKNTEKAIDSANRPQKLNADASCSDDMSTNDTAALSEEYAEKMKLEGEALTGKDDPKNMGKPVSKPADKKSKAKPTAKTKPNMRSADGSTSPIVSSSASENFAPSLNLSQSYQSVNQSSDRIAIFIDGSNLFYAASHLNIEVDYRRLLSSLVRGRRLLRAYFYTGVDPQNEKQRGFLLWLNRHGHRVVSKELTHLPDGSRKANMHVEMAVDMMRISEYCPNITLLGGDGNLAYALEVLSQRGTFIEVVSLQSMTSDSLIDLADSYTDLADLRDDIKR
ncbi:MAG: NYN domain-containing protein [Cyanobacteria bacterium P01_C01_bin.69]